jgi:cellulose biosynthesis protein BcsQ
VFEPRIEILNRTMFESPDALANASTAFIQRNFAAMQSRFDHLVFDFPAGAPGQTDTGVKLYVAIPDVRSLAGIQKFQTAPRGTERHSKVICALNRFDPANALHKEVLGWYRENFRDLVVIHESPLVSEALAEGTTVLDWAPEASVSADFLSLFAVVSRAIGEQTERLPLCS